MPNKPFLVATFVCLLLGLAVGEAFVIAETRQLPTSFVLPAARIGDNVTYVGFSRGGFALGPELDTGWSVATAQTTHVKRPGWIYGGTGEYHHALPLVTITLNPTTGDEWGRGFPDLGDLRLAQPPPGDCVPEGDFCLVELTETPARPAPGPVGEDAIRFMAGAVTPFTIHIDLATRQVVRQESADENQPWSPFSETHVSFWTDDLGTWNDPVGSLNLQGKPLRLGDDLTPTTVDLVPAERHYPHEPVSPETSGRTFLRVWVAAQARVEGEAALGVRFHEKRQYENAYIGESGGLDHTWALEDCVTTVWMTQNTPYPALTESTCSRTGPDGATSKDEYRSVQTRFVAGQDEIPWNEDPPTPAPNYPPTPTIVEATPQRPFADGVAPGLSYPLAEALGDIERLAAQTGLDEWRLNHPDAVLAGLRYGPTHLTRGEHGWFLVWATPAGQAFPVAALRSDDTTAARLRDYGPQPVRPFDGGRIPARTVALDSAEALWRYIASAEHANETLNFVEWGIGNWSPVYDVCAEEVRYDWADPGEAPGIDLATLALGHRTAWNFLGGCQTAEEDYVGQDVFVLALEARTGNPLALFERADLPAETETFDYEPRYVAAEDVAPAGLRLPSLEVTALAATSLFTLFLAVYLSPLWKYGALKWLAWVPAYSKLRQDRLLDSRVRDELLRAIEADPGASATELGKRVGIGGWGTLVYHLSVLESNKLISSLVDGRNRRFFPAGAIDWSERGQLAVLRNSKTRMLFELISEEPGVMQQRLLGQVGMSRPAGGWHLRRLEESGLIGRVREGRRVRYYANNREFLQPPPGRDEGMEVA